ncbi:hypothetical protein B0O99DRAFT_681407 [Bisporella sp. PMI_857]|nr:hypothetical protein B0O99DRAFT_681407 [Bisporella sp. PMI_857]
MVHLLNNDNRPVHENDLAYIEPRFCMDPNCTFPFGDICTECGECYEARKVSKEDDFTFDGQGNDGKAASKKGGSISSSTGEKKLVISVTDIEELVARRSLWLDELFERTVEYQTQGRVFVGGAIPEADEAEQLNPTIEKSSPASSNIDSSSVKRPDR